VVSGSGPDDAGSSKKIKLSLNQVMASKKKSD
jgi:hypothetical protein